MPPDSLFPSYSLSKWDLSELFPSIDGPELQAAIDELEAKTLAFEAHRSQLATSISGGEFINLLDELESLTRRGNRLGSYAGLVFAGDTQDQAAQALQARVDQLLASWQNRVLFFEIWWKELDEANAERLMALSGDSRYWLETLRQFKPHTLSEAEEKIVNLKNVTGSSAFNTLYDAITNRYTFKITVNGEQQELTRGELMVYVRSHDPYLRQVAYQELYRVYAQDGPILGQIYQTLVRDWRSEQVDLRKFANPIAARNLVNDIPDAVIDTLLEVAERNAGVFQRFFRLKARWLGVERLRRYDLYAPVAKSEKTYEFSAAAHMVLDAFRRFEPRLATLAQSVFDQDHLDSQVRKGKKGGAFCATVTPDLTPWVLVNFQGRPDDVATVAHELGHAIHSLLAADHNAFTQHASLPLAETASTFGEMMLIDRLLEVEQDAGVRRDLLFRQVDDAYATIMRQVFFALFERQAHDLTDQGATVDELCEAYFANLQRQFGDAVEMNEEFRWEWVAIPHIFHVPFYVYAYAFGQLLVLALYQQYLAEGESFKPRYLKILQAGGSQAPAQILTEAGIDIARPEFWQGGFDVINRMIDRLAQLPIN
jgi:oligoendopeptidase F